jgi:hypothetical protein
VSSGQRAAVLVTGANVDVDVLRSVLSSS